MLKKEFHYIDYDGNEKSLTAYFHLNKNDCIDMDTAFEEEGGLIEFLKSLMKEAKENPEIVKKDKFVRFVRLLVSRSYGERPKNDPGLFLKEDEYGRPLVRKFKGTPAYDDYVFDLLTGKEDLGEFTDGIMPSINEQQRAEAERVLKQEGIELSTFTPELKEVQED